MNGFHRSIFAALLLAALASPAVGFSPAGHMVTGAIVYDELRARHPIVLQHIVEIMAQHPDHGSFEVAMDPASGEGRTLRLLMEMARWPDDVRKSSYDHPTWHYASKPLFDPHRPPPGPLPGAAAGSALEAFALNVSVARDPRAPAAERAIALCWIFHLVGDMHQPLHAADRYSIDYPTGDHGGGLAYIIDPQTQGPMSLHWFWDQAVNRASDAAAPRATALQRRYPRSVFAQLATDGHEDDMTRWTAESYALARTEAYRTDLATGVSEQQAAALTPGYAANAAGVAEEQLTLAGYRLADLLSIILP